MLRGSDPNCAGRLVPKLAHRGEFGLDLLDARSSGAEPHVRQPRSTRRCAWCGLAGVAQPRLEPRIVWLSADCETPSFAAARVKLCSRATATRHGGRPDSHAASISLAYNCMHIIAANPGFRTAHLKVEHQEARGRIERWGQLIRPRRRGNATCDGEASWPVGQSSRKPGSPKRSPRQSWRPQATARMLFRSPLRMSSGRIGRRRSISPTSAASGTNCSKSQVTGLFGLWIR